MIDKGLYRKNFSVGGRDGPGSGDSGGKSGNSGGDGPSGRDRGMGMAGKTGDYSSGPTGNDGGGNRFSNLTKNVLNPNIDFRGPTAFGPTQKYSGSGFLSGYRNIDPITGQPKMGLSYLADRVKSFASNLNPISVIGGLVAGPFGSILGQGFSKLGALKDYNTLADYAKGEFGLFSDEDEEDVETQDIRDKFNRLGITTPVGITNTTPGLNFINAPQNIEGYNTITAPSANPTDYDFFSNAMAKLNKVEQRAYDTLKMGKELGINTEKQNKQLEELEQKKNESSLITGLA